MEWVETTGTTVQQAKELALDQLGVDEADAEFEVVQDAKRELFGLRKTEARVRARVRPTAPPPKRGRGRGRDGAREGGGRSGGAGGRSRGRGGRGGSAARQGTEQGGRSRDESSERGEGSRARSETGEDEKAASRTSRGSQDEGSTKERAVSDFGVMDQAALAEDFLLGLAERMGIDDASTSSEQVDDEIAEVRLDGGDVGLLVGRRGATLQALQELTKTVLQRQTPPDAEGRIRVDVAGYRERRREALEAFVREVAQEVLDTGEERALEPMSSPDRKIVHDTVNEIDGVGTTSEGADPRRRVVIVPA